MTINKEQLDEMKDMLPNLVISGHDDPGFKDNAPTPIDKVFGTGGVIYTKGQDEDDLTRPAYEQFVQDLANAGDMQGLMLVNDMDLIRGMAEQELPRLEQELAELDRE